jgi:hypothetical protein
MVVVLLVVAGVALWLALLVCAVVLCRAAALGDDEDPAIGLSPAVRRRARRLGRRLAEDGSVAAAKNRESSNPSSPAADAPPDVTSTHPSAADGAWLRARD